MQIGSAYKNLVSTEHSLLLELCELWGFNSAVKAKKENYFILSWGKNIPPFLSQ